MYEGGEKTPKNPKDLVFWRFQRTSHVKHDCQASLNKNRARISETRNNGGGYSGYKESVAPKGDHKIANLNCTI